MLFLFSMSIFFISSLDIAHINCALNLLILTLMEVIIKKIKKKKKLKEGGTLHLKYTTEILCRGNWTEFYNPLICL